MVIPIGVSPCDFVKAIGLLRNLIKALASNAGASADYRGLVNELRNLKRALKAVDDLDFNEAFNVHRVAAQQASVQCQNLIEDFVKKNTKFAAALGANSHEMCSAWRRNLCKLQWSLDRPDDVRKLRASIAEHVSAIGVLLTTAHLEATKLQSTGLQHLTENNKKQIVILQDTHNTAKTVLEQLLLSTQSSEKNAHATIKTLDLAQEGVDISRSTHELLNKQQSLIQYTRDTSDERHDAIMTEISRMGAAIGELGVFNKLKNSMPQQVLFQQHAFLEDAHGRIFPIQTDFVASWEAFHFVLMTHFENMPGQDKVRRRMYTIGDLRTSQDIDTSKPFKTAFRPRSNRTMSVQFPYPGSVDEHSQACLICHATNDGYDKGTEFICKQPDCGFRYTLRQRPGREREANASSHRMVNDTSMNYCKSSAMDSADEKSSETMSDFRRVQILLPASVRMHGISRNATKTLQLGSEAEDLANTTPQAIPDPRLQKAGRFKKTREQIRLERKAAEEAYDKMELEGAFDTLPRALYQSCFEDMQGNATNRRTLEQDNADVNASDVTAGVRQRRGLNEPSAQKLNLKREPCQADCFLLRQLDPYRPDIAHEVRQRPLESESNSESESESDATRTH